jgi:hypothetical protein
MAIEVDTRKQFFIDWRWVQEGWIGFEPRNASKIGVPTGTPHGVRPAAQKAKKSPPYLVADKPWELVVHR